MINNRELSWLAFNDRVLQEAQDKSVPLIQRLRFLGIFSNNQDEFIKVRVADIIRANQNKDYKSRLLTGGYSAKELLAQINSHFAESQKIFSNTYHDILKEMEDHDIWVLNEQQLDQKQKAFCLDYFWSIISPRLVPLILRKTTQIPFLRDNNIYLAVKMVATKENTIRYAIIQIPVSTNCPRFVKLPPSQDNRSEIIFVDDIIRLCLDEIFFMFNYKSISAFTFKLMRDSELTLDDDISKSLMEKMVMGLQNRIHGQPIRLIYDREMPTDLLDTISSKLGLKDSEALSSGGRYHLKRDLMQFPKVRPDLESENLPPLHHIDIKPSSSILKAINKKDILLNYPYHTFNHFIDLLREAAIDPKVDSIYITLYRVAEQSKVVNALINAAKNGKKVVVLIELLARFDEEQNIAYSEMLQKEGVKVIHGVNGLKVHSKIVLIKRKNKGYVYIGTGNLNETTAKLYVDFGLLTSNPQIVADAESVFDFLMNTHRHFTCKQLVVSPYYMRKKFESLIRKEIKNAQIGKKAYIWVKLNTLTDEQIINLLYKASRAGVEIHLIVRGVCLLQPGVENLSENIQAISIVDRFLEHSRIAIFGNDGDEKIYIMSADWMSRNLDRRVEVGVPINDPDIKRVIKNFFETQWSDNEKARDLSSLAKNEYIKKGTNKTSRSQTALYDYYKEMKE